MASPIYDDDEKSSKFLRYVITNPPVFLRRLSIDMTRGELSVRMLLLLMLALLVAAPGADGFLSASVNTITPAGYSSSSNHNYRYLWYECQ